MEYRARQEKVEAAVAAKRLDTLLVTHLPNVRYLCGFSGSAGILAIGDHAPVLFTDGRYTVQAREEVRGARVAIGKESPLAMAAAWAGSRRRPVLGIESEHLTVGLRTALRQRLPAAARLRATSGLVEKFRLIKDAEELARIRAAAELGASLLQPALAAIRPGRSETEVAAEMEYAARRAGAEAMSFETIVASGARSALPHGRASRQKLPERGFVILDFGVILEGYCSDMTRTVHLGRAWGEERRRYEAVRQAQQAATEAVRAGQEAGLVDRAARRVLQRAGWGRFFTHSTGHGVGLEIHEGPRLARGQRETLEAGMVVTIEPGVYVAGEGGVRIEDMVVVTDSGCEVLTPASKELIEL